MLKRIMKGLAAIKDELWITSRLKLICKAFTVRRIKEQFRHNSYSQLGEDRMIVFYLKQWKHLDSISYLDIGANHPFNLSNTALLDETFDIKKGVLVEPDYNMSIKLKKNRQGMCENIGITGNKVREGEKLTYYVMNSSVLNTFKLEEVKKSEKRGAKLLETREVPVMNINDLLKKYFENDTLDVLSIDVEGMDDEIVKAIDYEKYQPLLICIETNHTDRETLNVFMDEKGYKVFGLTCVNTIYIRKED